MTPYALEGMETVPVEAPRSGAIWGGIDSGKKGASALVFPDGSIKSWRTPLIGGKVYDLMAVARIVREMRTLGVKLVILERQQPAHSQGPGGNNAVRASFGIGYGYAMWQTALVMAGVPHEIVAPGVWKKRMGIAVPSSFGDQKARQKEAKRRSVTLCQRMHPEHDLRWNPGHHSSKPSHDQAEAILLADYGERHVGST